MNESIKTLIRLAEESGSLSLKEKATILKKAKEIGEDVDEIEMLLEAIPIDPDDTNDVVTSKREDDVHSQKKRCPNCGAVLSDFILQCPECGYVFSSESGVSKANRDYVAELNSKLEKVDKRRPKTKEEREWDSILDSNKAAEKAEIIRAFSVPNTKEALIQAFVSCFSSYQVATAPRVKAAWLAKAKEFQLLLSSQPEIDSSTMDLITKYMLAIGNAEKDEVKKNKKAIVYACISMVFILLMLGVIAIMMKYTG